MMTPEQAWRRLDKAEKEYKALKATMGKMLHGVYENQTPATRARLDLLEDRAGKAYIAYATARHYWRDPERPEYDKFGRIEYSHQTKRHYYYKSDDDPSIRFEYDHLGRIIVDHGPPERQGYDYVDDETPGLELDEYGNPIVPEDDIEEAA